MENQVFSCYWSPKDGWHFSYKNKELWQIREGFMTADVIDGGYKNHREFVGLHDALECIRTD